MDERSGGGSVGRGEPPSRSTSRFGYTHGVMGGWWSWGTGRRLIDQVRCVELSRLNVGLIEPTRATSDSMGRATTAVDRERTQKALEENSDELNKTKRWGRIFTVRSPNWHYSLVQEEPGKGL